MTKKWAGRPKPPLLLGKSLEQQRRMLMQGKWVRVVSLLLLCLMPSRTARLGGLLHTTAADVLINIVAI